MGKHKHTHITHEWAHYDDIVNTMPRGRSQTTPLHSSMILYHGSLKHNRNVLAKVAMDRFLMTPPYLALTLFGLRVLETGRPRASLEGARRVYGGALVKNYQVWTVAQLVNFNYVSPAYRVLFGNVVALWWSFYLSTTAASSQR
jgi:hypothetical protein